MACHAFQVSYNTEKGGGEIMRERKNKYERKERDK